MARAGSFGPYQPGELAAAYESWRVRADDQLVRGQAGDLTATEAQVTERLTALVTVRGYLQDYRWAYLSAMDRQTQALAVRTQWLAATTATLAIAALGAIGLLVRRSGAARSAPPAVGDHAQDVDHWAGDHRQRTGTHR